MNHTIEDLMTIVMGREVKDRDVIHCGAFTPLVLVSGMWAMAHHAPNAVILPLSLSGVRIFKPFPVSYSLIEGMTMRAGVQYTMVDIFTHVEGPDGVAYEPVNPLQIDVFGNVNMSVIGDFDTPRFRGPGAAGADILPIMMNHELIIYCPRHSPRVFVEEVDFVTAAGNEPSRRRDSGAPNGGIKKVITNLGVLDFDTDGRMVLRSTHPGVTVDEVRAQTGFDLQVSDDLTETPPPTEEELETLAWVDPIGIRQFEFKSALERREELPALLEREYEYFSELVDG